MSIACINFERDHREGTVKSQLTGKDCFVQFDCSFNVNVDVSSGAFDYEYGSIHGTHVPGPDVDFDGISEVTLYRHNGTVAKSWSENEWYSDRWKRFRFLFEEATYSLIEKGIGNFNPYEYYDNEPACGWEFYRRDEY